MPEAVIVATARSPIGRAFKGSLTSIRPDDLTVQLISAALAKVPQLSPDEIDDLDDEVSKEKLPPTTPSCVSWPRRRRSSSRASIKSSPGCCRADPYAGV